MSTILERARPALESRQGQRLEILSWLKNKKSTVIFGKEHLPGCSCSLFYSWPFPAGLFHLSWRSFKHPLLSSCLSPSSLCLTPSWSAPPSLSASSACLSWVCTDIWICTTCYKGAAFGLLTTQGATILTGSKRQPASHVLMEGRWRSEGARACQFQA